MAAINMIMIESDVRYIDKLALKFLKEMNDDIELEVITELDYYRQYISSPRKIDVLIINETMFNDNIRKQNVGLVVILKETEDLSVNGNFLEIYKYTNLQEIYLRIYSRIQQVFQLKTSKNNNNDSELIMVYSPLGGCGRTTIALGISCALSDLGKKVLYINAETIQSFQLYFKEESYIDNGLERNLIIHNEGILSYLKGAVGNCGFDYLKPIKHSMIAYGIKPGDYEYFIDLIVKSKLYDCVVIDVSAQFDESNSALMEKSDKVLFVLKQEYTSVYKVHKMLENIDTSNSSKFLFVCNKYTEQKENCISSREYLRRITVTEYVNYDPVLEQTVDIATIKNSKMLKSTAYLLV